MNKLLIEFQASVQKIGITKKDRLLLAVSGGLDSVVMTVLSSISGFDFGIAHANFQLRGVESERDEAFVRALAEKYNKPFFLQKFDTLKYAEAEKCSIQVAARKLRYNWFKTLIGKTPDSFKFLFTAHHLDDNVETMLMHFFRGTGIRGLTGMPVQQGHLVRPLLSVPGKQLREFASIENLSWVEDSSNASDDYTRNYFRNQLIPSISKVFPDVQANMENNLFRFSEVDRLYQQALSVHKKKLMNFHNKEVHIPILLLKKTEPLRTILFEILKDYHFTQAQIDDVIHLMDSSNGKYISSISHRIIKNRSWLIIAPQKDSTVSHIVIDENQQNVIYPEGKLTLRKIISEESGFISMPTISENLDAEKIQFPLILRKWKAGDYFYPLGMKKKKKLARFFIDQKLSKTAKEKVWVLVMDSHIVCVIGQRIDNRFRITESTRQILLVQNVKPE